MAEEVVQFLRRFSKYGYRNGEMNSEAFKCNEGSLSYYIRHNPLDTYDGALALRDHSCQIYKFQFGLFELDNLTLRSFGLNPTYNEDTDDERFGKFHHESVCFEEIFSDDGDKAKNATAILMKLRKMTLATMAAQRIVVEFGGEFEPASA